MRADDNSRSSRRDAYGPGRDYDIDTTKKFTVRASFDLPRSYDIELTQGRNNMRMQSDCNRNSLADM